MSVIRIETNKTVCKFLCCFEFNPYIEYVNINRLNSIVTARSQPKTKAQLFNFFKNYA